MSVELRGGDAAAAALARTSRELRKVVGMVEDLETVLGLTVSISAAAGADQMLELQKLDHIQQKILGVADFLEALGRLMPADWRVDAHAASRCVLLAELGDKLGDAEAASTADGVAAVELF